MRQEAARKPHAALDLHRRRLKGQKIERLLGLEHAQGPWQLLEVGAGSGGISHYFGTHASGRFSVVAVDVHDSRQVSDGYRFELVGGVQLPYEDNSFDVVLSNHVIEHVGSDSDQAGHLAELRRVMKPGAVGYLAVPNRWMLVEPHYRLAFLSWWPEPLRSRWLRLWGKGDFYDCRPMSCGDLERRLSAVGFRFEQLHAEALSATFEIERPEAFVWKYFLQFFPAFIFSRARHGFPTLIYRLHKK